MSSLVALSKIQIPGNIRSIPGVDDLYGTPVSEFPLDIQAHILSLAEDINERGLLQPIVIKDLGKGKGFRLIAGFCRFKAVQHNGGTTIDSKSIKGKTEDESIIKLVENVKRKNLNPIDVAHGLDDIRQIKKITKQADLAKVVGMSSAWISQHLNLLKADQTVQDSVLSGEMGLQAARSIAALPSEQQAGAVKDAQKEAKEAGKKKVSSKGARRQATKRKNEAAGKQPQLKLLEDREQEQKDLVCKDFIDVHFGDSKTPEDLAEARVLAEAFWDYLMSKNRLYIYQ